MPPMINKKLMAIFVSVIALPVIVLVAAVSCAPAPNAGSDTNSPEGVRVQVIEDPRYQGGQKCVVFTHDAGANQVSIAAVC